MEEAMAIKELRQDKEVYTHSVLWGAVVVLNKWDNINKTHGLLVQRDTYIPLTADLTKKPKSKLINKLRNIKSEGGLGDIPY